MMFRNSSFNSTLGASLGFLALGLGLGASETLKAEALPDACGMLTQAQVSAALGIPVDAGVRPIAADPRVCNWRESNKPNGPGRNVMLTFISAKQFDNLKQLPLSTAASGVGDEAIVTRAMRMPTILTVKAGTHYFRILVRSDLAATAEVDERNQSIEKSLGAKIVSKL
jgi:hypothetical protein